MSGVIPDVSVQTFFHQSGPRYTDFPRQILWIDRIGNQIKYNLELNYFYVKNQPHFDLNK